MACERYSLLFLAISIAFVTPQIVLSAYGQSNNTVVYSKDSSPYGVPYKDWIARWWQWDVGQVLVEMWASSAPGSVLAYHLKILVKLKLNFRLIKYLLRVSTPITGLTIRFSSH